MSRWARSTDCSTRGSDGETIDTFWFATSMPGAPIRMEKRLGGELVFSSTAIVEQRP